MRKVRFNFTVDSCDGKPIDVDMKRISLNVWSKGSSYLHREDLDVPPQIELGTKVVGGGDNIIVLEVEVPDHLESWLIKLEEIIDTREYKS